MGGTVATDGSYVAIMLSKSHTLMHYIESRHLAWCTYFSLVEPHITAHKNKFTGPGATRVGHVKVAAAAAAAARARAAAAVLSPADSSARSPQALLG